MHFVFIHFYWKLRSRKKGFDTRKMPKNSLNKAQIYNSGPPFLSRSNWNMSKHLRTKIRFWSPQKSAADNNKHCLEIFLKSNWSLFILWMVGYGVPAEGKIDISQRTDCNVTSSLFNAWKLGAYNNLPTSSVGLRKSSTKSITCVLTNMGRRHFSGPLLNRHCYRLRPRLQKSHRRSPLSWFSCWNFTFNWQASILNFEFQVSSCNLDF